jgi:ADP-ribosyl-[dinitrogen reductase] hydrolase
MTTAGLRLDRSLGALLGLAVGDALGAAAEGKQRDSYPRISELGPSEPHGLAAGEWTDDTAMAICLAESLLACGGLDQRDLLDRFVRWLRLGENACGGRAAGISPTTRVTLEEFERSGRLDAADAARNAGNGCIMRLAPVAIFHRRDVIAARACAELQARVTHTAEEAVAAAAMLAELLVAALESGDPARVAVVASRTAHPALVRVVEGGRTKQREEISSAPRAVDTLEAALWCLVRADSFEAAVGEAVNLGGDTDTIGAVTGQLAGAVFGASAIPVRWAAPLHSASRLAELARRLHETRPRIVRQEPSAAGAVSQRSTRGG